jgi:hypothetical protein
VTHAWVDAGFKQDFAVHGAVLGIDVEVVKRGDTQAGFVPVKKRWIVEQVYGTLMLHAAWRVSTRAGRNRACPARCGPRWPASSAG